MAHDFFSDKAIKHSIQRETKKNFSTMYIMSDLIATFSFINLNINHPKIAPKIIIHYCKWIELLNQSRIFHHSKIKTIHPPTHTHTHTERDAMHQFLIGPINRKEKTLKEKFCLM